MVIKAKRILTEWIINFIRNKDAVLGNLENIEENKEDYEVKAIYKDKEEYIIVEPFIKDFEEIFKKIDKEKNISIAIFNTIENLEIIIENWKKLIDFEKLTIYFVNMFSETDKKWILKPYMHNKIAEEKSLKTGLKSMFDMVGPIDEQDIERQNL